MYIKQIREWGGANWEEFFSQFPLLKKEERGEVRQILTLPTKEGIEASFKRLSSLWIINWIWPWYLMRNMRKFISWAFRGVRYEWHDVMYAIWWTETDRLNADYWLFKYSYQSTMILVIKWRMRVNPFLWLFLYPLALTQIVLAFLCFMAVVLFWRFWSFRYIK